MEQRCRTLPLISSTVNNEHFSELNTLPYHGHSKPKSLHGLKLSQQGGGYFTPSQYQKYFESYGKNSAINPNPYSSKKSSELLELCYRNRNHPRQTWHLFSQGDNYERFSRVSGFQESLQNPTPTFRFIEPGNPGSLTIPTRSYDSLSNFGTNVPIKLQPVQLPANYAYHIPPGSNNTVVKANLKDNSDPEIGKPPQWNLNRRANVSLDLKAAYSKLVPLIKRTTPNNMNDLFIATLIECLHHVPLDDFYLLLSNENTPELIKPLPIWRFKIDKSPYTCYKIEGLTLCFYILQTFRKRRQRHWDIPIDLVHNPRLFRLKPHEIRRTFLAIKILFDSVEEVKGPLWRISTISRPSMKNAYHFICQKLLEKYPTNSSILPLEKVEVCESQLGRITKSIYPGLSTRRLGKRGDSVYHYVGLAWNKNIIDDELVHEIEESKPRVHIEITD